MSSQVCMCVCVCVCVCVHVLVRAGMMDIDSMSSQVCMCVHVLVYSCNDNRSTCYIIKFNIASYIFTNGITV